MVLWAILLFRAAKFGIGLLVVAGTVLVSKEVIDWKYTKDDLIDDVMLSDSGAYPEEHELTILDRNYHLCLKMPSKEFCLMSVDHKLQFLEAKTPIPQDNFVAIDDFPESRRRHPIDVAIEDFSHLMEVLNVEVAVIEPSILFCMLDSKTKALLQRMGFQLSRHMGAHNVVTFAALPPNATNLDTRAARSFIRSKGFHQITVKRTSDSWLDYSKRKFPTHYFFTRRLIVVHVVVFYNRGEYFWHSGIKHNPPHVQQLVPKESILFSSADSTYERFSTMPLEMNDVKVSGLPRIPISASHFLQQIRSSKFLECKPSGVPNSNKTTSLSVFNAQDSTAAFVSALKEMKTMFQALLMDFILFGGTLFGWYWQCDIASSSTSITFAAFQEKMVEEINFFQNFEGGYCTGNKRVMDLPQEPYKLSFACLDQTVDVYFLHKGQETFWISMPRPVRKRLYLRYHYPKFEICSADLLHHRVLVPCNPEDILKSEGSLEGMKLVSNNETSTTRPGILNKNSLTE